MNSDYQILGADSDASGVQQPLVAQQAAAATASWWTRLWWLLFGGLTVFDVAGIIAVVVMGILIGYYSAQTGDAKDQTDRRLATHFDTIRLIENRASWMGVPWYEAVDVPGSCMDEWIMRQETRAGFRP